jgi:MFS transporter, DHA1 family, inner membrane transport protein
LKAALTSIIALRTVINVALRAPLPFLGAIAATFGASTQSVGWLGVAFSMAAFVAPFSGMVEGRLGRRRTVVLSMGLFVIMCLLTPFAPSLLSAAILFVLMGVAKSLFEPQSLAFVSENVPVEKRGVAIGLVELAWALSWIIGTPLLGYLIEYSHWWMIFVLMAGAALICTVAVLKFAGMRDAPGASVQGRFSLAGIRAVLGSPVALRMLVYGFLIALPAQITGLIYGPYVQQQFTLSPVQLGIASTVIGLADLLAELATVAFVDRIGQRRALLGSCALYAASLVLFVALATSFAGVLLALFFVFFFFEFTLVTSLAVQSELLPRDRATMGGFTASVHGFARIIGSLSGLALLGWGGIALPMVFGALAIVLALVAGWQLGRPIAPALASTSAVPEPPR